MATTIQTIELPKKARALDTSGNNNHGQIYSGRGLEFDGVSDYLSMSDVTTGLTSCTIAVWYKKTIGTSSNTIAGYNSGGSYLRFNSATGFAVYFPTSNGQAVSFSSTIPDTGVWNRLVITLTSADQLVYVNGVLNTTAVIATIGTLFHAQPLTRIGSYAGGSLFDGKMSDFQIWDTAWSAADVTYDYLNPESLALNRGGTSLTNSNLKLWYPMQDGHRGQQSYILDGANTGIVSATLDDDFSTDTTGDYDAISGTISYDSDNNLLKHEYADSNGNRLKRDNTLVVDQPYKITFKARGTRATAFTAVGANDIDGAITNPTLTTNFQDYEFNTIASTHHCRFYQTTGSADEYLEITNILIQPINDKNHATTVFHGDELVTNGTFTSATTGWDSSDSALSIVSNQLLITGAGAGGGYGGAWQVISCTIGRQYILSWDYTAGTHNSYVDITGATGVGVNSNFGGTGSYSISFVATSNTPTIKMYVDGTAAGATGTYDNISVKEIGVATGWTDADQQLHIPQTALQSYNELAWFDGVGDYVSIADHNDFTFGDGSNDSVFSVSAWIYPSTLAYFSIVDKYSSNDKEYLLELDNNGKLFFRCIDESAGSYIGRKYNTALTEGKWHHVVATYDASEASSGINLYLNGVNVDDTDSESGSYTAMQNENGILAIGLRSDGALYANGVVTEVAIWGTELSQAEVNELYNDGKALDATTHSESSNIKGYWRNNGLNTWSNLNNPGTHDGTPTSLTETILIPAGVDSTRDNQGFIMNRQKDTSCLNLTSGDDDVRLVAGDETYDIDGGNFSFSFWIKFRDGDGTLQTIFGNRGISAYYSNISMENTYVEIETLTSGEYARGTFTALTDDNWYHFTCTTGGDGTVIWYKDGITTGVTLSYDTGSAIQNNITIGSIGASQEGAITPTSYDCKSAIDGVLIYNDTLTALEVLRNYNAGKGSHRN